MKRHQNTFSFLFIFLFLLIGNIGSAQVFSRYIHNIGLTPSQKKQSQEIRKDIQTQRKALYTELSLISKENVEEIKAIHQQIKDLTDQEEKRFIDILLVEQREIYETNKEEKLIEQQLRQEQSELGRLQRNFPNITFTNEQITKITKKRAVIQSTKFGYDTEGRKARKQAEDEMMKSVLNNQQYTQYVEAKKELKEQQEALILAKIEKYQPIVEELLVIVDEFALPKYKKLRAKLESKISDRDKEELEDIRNRRIEHFENDLYSKVDNEFAEIENPELIYRAEQIVQLVGSYSHIIGFMDEAIARKEIQVLVNRYDAAILNLQNELIWLNREVALKGATIIGQVYPIPFPEQMIPKQTELSNHEKRMFLLLDPAVDFSLEDWNTITKGEGQHQAIAYPSPAHKNQTLEFDVPQNGKVTVEILDESGRMIRQLFSKNMNAGKQVINISVGDLNPQIYFYRITTEEGTTMLKFVVVK